MQYQQQPQHGPPPGGKGSGGGKAPRNCLIACLASICVCCAIEECCECWYVHTLKPFTDVWILMTNLLRMASFDCCECFL